MADGLRLGLLVVLVIALVFVPATAADERYDFESGATPRAASSSVSARAATT